MVVSSHYHDFSGLWLIWGGKRTFVLEWVVVAFVEKGTDTAIMRAIFIIALVSILFGCQKREPVISDAEFSAFKESHPGMLQTCLDEVRFGGLFEGRPNDPDCHEMLPAQRWSGLWEHGWEWTNFCPDPAKDCNWMVERGTWLTFAAGADPNPDLGDGVHRIVFIGRRTKVPGNFGHTASYQHLMVVDRIISIESDEKQR